jgi:hypothetical protein
MLEKIVHYLIAIGLLGWVVGALIQLVKYGAIMTPCCQ